MLWPTLSFLTLLTHTLAAAAAAPDIIRYDGQTSGKHIVKLKPLSDKDSFMSFRQSSSASATIKITHEWDSTFFNGFAGEFDAETLEFLRNSEDVQYIAEDAIMHAFASSSVVTQTDAPWGLSRISRTKPIPDRNKDVSALNYYYSYYDNAAREHDVDVYVLDTGIRITHEEFQGRASWGATFGGYDDADYNGHGTHCAGTIASSTYGVSKTANLIAVKVLNDEGAGSSTDIISGLEFVRKNQDRRGASVVSMSLGGTAFAPLDEAVTALIDEGVHVVVAAGNEARDAYNNSPARVRTAITVGATDIDDAIASFSNYGGVVDIFAPGDFIISTSNSSDTATMPMSGTSMATPHVSGMVAYLINRHGNQSPQRLTTMLKELALMDMVKRLPKGTKNLLLRNDVRG